MNFSLRCDRTCIVDKQIVPELRQREIFFAPGPVASQRTCEYPRSSSHDLERWPKVTLKYLLVWQNSREKTRLRLLALLPGFLQCAIGLRKRILGVFVLEPLHSVGFWIQCPPIYVGEIFASWFRFLLLTRGWRMSDFWEHGENKKRCLKLKWMICVPGWWSSLDDLV